MHFISRSSWSFVFFLAVLLAPSVLVGQGRFTVNGRMKVEGADLGNARVVVYKNGSKERSITSNLNKFTLDLDLNANYVLSFEKDGYVAKKVSFNTKAPAEAIANGFTPFDFAVSLFKQYDDINIVVFNQPVGMIRYDDNTGDFDYDTDYTKSIQSQLQQVLAQVEQKQKEEAAQEKEAEALAAEAAKAQAKADAEAAKLAAAKAKADAEAQKQAEAQAKLAEKQKVEAKKPEPPAVVVEKKKEPVVAEKPSPKPEPKAPKPPVVEKPVINALASKAVTGEDGRRNSPVIVMEEPSRIALAKTNVKEEERPVAEDDQPELVRNEEVLIEPSRVTAIVTMSVGDHTDEYRKVTHKFGAQYYFKNGATCTQEVYQRETLGEQLAGTTARSKMD